MRTRKGKRESVPHPVRVEERLRDSSLHSTGREEENEMEEGREGGAGERREERAMLLSLRPAMKGRRRAARGVKEQLETNEARKKGRFPFSSSVPLSFLSFSAAGQGKGTKEVSAAQRIAPPQKQEMNDTSWERNLKKRGAKEGKEGVSTSTVCLSGCLRCIGDECEGGMTVGYVNNGGCSMNEREEGKKGREGTAKTTVRKEQRRNERWTAESGCSGDMVVGGSGTTRGGE
jgi:hypothetical protein